MLGHVALAAPVLYSHLGYVAARPELLASQLAGTLGSYRADRLRSPTFFILGAPKCGTTSLAAWLREHPQVFIPKTKEPHFFNTDDRQGVTTFDGYLKLFSVAGNRQIALGEASVWYLSSSVAVENILRYKPEARFIVMLRNPIEMAPALHAEMVLGGHESVRDFHEAWDLQEKRRQGEHLPALSWARRRLLYGDVCALGAQLQKLLLKVPGDRVLTILLDDIAGEPRREYLRVLRFLGLDDDQRCEFPVHNSARRLRRPLLTRSLFIANQIKSRMGINLHLQLWDHVAHINVVPGPRKPLTPELAATLKHHFAADVALLGNLLGRDLRHWLA